MNKNSKNTNNKNKFDTGSSSTYYARTYTSVGILKQQQRVRVSTGGNTSIPLRRVQVSPPPSPPGPACYTLEFRRALNIFKTSK